MPVVDLEHLGLDAGGHLLVERALRAVPLGATLTVHGRHPALAIHLQAWCRRHGHQLDSGGAHPIIRKGSKDDDRWAGAVRAGSAAGVADRADPCWGLAARGALVESGGPPLDVTWVDRDQVWADVAPRLFAAAQAAQWDPATVVDWTQPDLAPRAAEDALVQIMTYLIENEQAALVIPARLIGQLHPHFREVMALLATQVADEARHVDVFQRRALLHCTELGVSGAGERASLQSLLDEHDFTLASFLLSVLGEGTFVDLLRFLNRHAPEPITAEITRLVARDEARHVAFGVAHTAHVATRDPAFLATLRAAVERRHDVLADTAGLNTAVFDALVVLAAGSWSPAAITAGWQAVQDMVTAMDEGRRRRLAFIGFPDDEAAAISALHTRTFM